MKKVLLILSVILNIVLILMLASMSSNFYGYKKVCNQYKHAIELYVNNK